MSLISASYSLIPVEEGAVDCGAGVVQIEAIGTNDRIDGKALGARKGTKLRSLPTEAERKDRRQRVLRPLLPLLNKANIANDFHDVLGFNQY